jgi:hypothetical protein
MNAAEIVGNLYDFETDAVTVKERKFFCKLLKINML